MSINVKGKWFIVVVLLVVAALPASIAGAASPATANLNPVLSPCDTLLLRTLGTVLPSQVQAPTANAQLLRDLGTVLPGRVLAPKTNTCGATTQASAPSVAAPSGYIYATSYANRDRLIDGRWHTYGDTTPTSLQAAPADGRWRTYEVTYPAAVPAASSRLCTLPNARTTVANC